MTDAEREAKDILSDCMCSVGDTFCSSCERKAKRIVEVIQRAEQRGRGQATAVNCENCYKGGLLRASEIADKLSDAHNDEAIRVLNGYLEALQEITEAIRKEANG